MREKSKEGLAEIQSPSDSEYSSPPATAAASVVLHSVSSRLLPLHALPILFSPLVLAVPVLLILLRVVFVQARQLTASRHTKKHRPMSYVVKWGRERLHFPLPQPNTKLAAIRHQLAEYTQLPPQSFKLIHAGAVMKDDNAPISAYGIKPNSTIALVGGGDPLPEPASRKSHKRTSEKQKPQERTEANTVAQIRGELDAVRRTLEPDVDVFLSALDPSQTPRAAPTAIASAAPPAPEPRVQPPSGKQGQLGGRHPDLALEHVRLGELLLQTLLRLDAIATEGEWEEARKERKGAVREVQALLDRLDGGWRAKRAQTA